MEFDLQTLSKKTWSIPQLTAFGTVERITQGCDKDFGATDGLTLQGQPIQCAS